MPTITATNVSGKIETTQPTQPSSDTRRMAAVAAIEGSRIAQDAPGQALTSTPTLTPGDGKEASISQPDASNKQSDTDQRLAAMARKEKQVWAELKKVKAEKEALAKSQEGRMSRDEWAAQFRKDPTSLGLSYDELGQTYLNQNAPVDPQVAALRAQIEELKAGQKQVVSQAEQAQKQAYDQALAQIDREAKALISKTDAYEVTRSQGAEQAVTKLIELTYQEEGVLMDVEEAAAQVEAYLEQEALSLFQRSQKLRMKLIPAAPAPSAEAQQSKQQHNPQTQKINTLTHAMTQASSKPLSRRDRAILIAQGKNPDTGR